MTRPLRIQYPGAVYHVTCRGKERRKIYHDDTDRIKFLEILAQTKWIYTVKIHGYVLMSNHFCPSCHAKKVIEFGGRLGQSILYPVPHRQYVFTVPILLRVYFKYDRRLLSKLCRSAYESLLIFLRTTLKLPHGIPGCIMTIQTFGEYPDRFHPHLHALVSDELFKRAGTFYVMPKVDLKFLEEIFRAKVLGMLKAEGKIGDETIRKLLIWRHLGFNVHNGVRIRR